MARIETILSQNAPGIVPQAEGPAGAFQSGLQPAAANSLAGAANTISEALTKRKQEEEQMWVMNSMAKAQKEWMENMEKRKAAAGDGAPNFTPNLIKDFDQYVSQATANAPTGTAQKALESNLKNLGLGLERQALGFESQERLSYIVRQNAMRIDNDSMIVYRNPEALNDMLGNNETCAGILSKRLSPSEGARVKLAGSTQLITAAMQSYGDNNPQAGIDLIDSGKLDGKIDGNQLINMRQMLINKKGTVDGVQKFYAQQDAEKMVYNLEHGAPLPENMTPENIAQRMGGTPDQIKVNTLKLQKQAQISNEIGKSSQVVRFGTPEDVFSVLENHKPYPNTAGSAEPRLIQDQNGNIVPSLLTPQDEESIYAGLVKMNNERIKGLSEDSMGYAMEEPSLAKKFENANISDNPQDLIDAINEGISSQIRMGVPPQDVKPIRLSDQIAIANSLKTLKPDEFQNYIGQQRVKYGGNEAGGGYFDKILNSVLALPKDKAPDARYIFAAKNSGNPAAVSTILETIHETNQDPEKISKILNAQKKDGFDPKGDIDNLVFDQSSQASSIASSLVPTMGVDFGVKMQNLTRDVAQLLYYKKEAPTPEDAYEMANSFVVNSMFSGTGKTNTREYPIPKNSEKTGKPYTEEEQLRLKANLTVLPKIWGDILSKNVTTTEGTTSEISNLSKFGVFIMNKNMNGYNMYMDYGPGNRALITIKNGKLSTDPDAKPLFFSADKLTEKAYNDSSAKGLNNYIDKFWSYTY